MHTRRAALIGAGAAALSTRIVSAHADTPASLSNHPGFRAWDRPSSVARLPMAQMVETASGQASLAAWIGRRPAVLILWASWCAPCLVEKRYQAAMAQRLVSGGAWTRLFALQAYDAALDFDGGRRMLDRLGAESLPNARLMPGAEAAFQRLFNTTSDRTAQILPVTMLVGGDGLELGRAVGAMTAPDGETDYWQDEATFDFLSRLF